MRKLYRTFLAPSSCLLGHLFQLLLQHPFFHPILHLLSVAPDFSHFLPQDKESLMHAWFENGCAYGENGIHWGLSLSLSLGHSVWLSEGPCSIGPTEGTNSRILFCNGFPSFSFLLFIQPLIHSLDHSQSTCMKVLDWALLSGESCLTQK